MYTGTPKTILQHRDLKIELHYDKTGKEIYTGTSERYEPYQATAATAIDCFFCFNIQLSEQKQLAGLIK